MLLVFAILAENQCFAQRSLAIRNAKIETVSKAGVIEDGVILVRDGKIEAIGKDVKIPLAAQVIDAKGKTIMPGIVDPYYVVTVGRDAQSAGETRTIVVRGQTITVPGGPPSSSTSFTKISDSIDLDNIDWKAATRSGITTLQLVVSGYAQSVIVQPTVKSAQIVNQDGKLLVSVTNSTPSLELLRNGLRAPGSGPGGPRPPAGATPGATPPVSPTQKLWTEVREGKSSLFVNLNNAATILHCVAATKESKQAKLVFIVSGSDLFEASSDLDPKSHVAILPPRIDFVPNTRDRINIPKFLSEKEMPFAFSLSLGQNEFRAQLDTPLFAVSSLVHNGLSRQRALEALTMMPAKLIGVDGQVGSLEVGKKANFLILDGDPFAATTSIQRVFVEGKQIDEN